MRRIAPVALSVLLAAAACGSGETPGAPGAPASTVAVDAYLADLTSIDPRLAVYPKGAVNNAVNTCADLAAVNAGNLTADQLYSRLAARFSTGSNSNWTMDRVTAQKVLPIIGRYYCPAVSPALTASR